jgi:Contractile injection system tube protein
MKLIQATIQSENHINIKCMFNPDDITYTKDVGWANQPTNGTQIPAGAFSGGHAATLDIVLFLDSTEDGTNTDIAKEVNKLVSLTKIDPSLPYTPAKGGASKSAQHRPPKCTFAWGNYLSFDAVIERISVHYLLFLADGTPVRASATLKLKQIGDKDTFPPQNPTSGGRTGERLHRLAPRETLDQVAWAEFGKPGLWRAIAAFNGIDDPLRLRAGDPILLPASADDLKDFA